jgi:uncharacterized protein YhjY with autotransporter beta-barrel domain
MNSVGVPYSLPYQLSAWGGRPFTKRDLIALSLIEGNDGMVASGTLHNLYPGTPDGSAFGANEAVALADLATSSMRSAIDSFINAGARNILLTSFSDLSVMPATANAPHRGSLQIYGENVFRNLQEKLLPQAQAGTRIFLIDTSRIGEQFNANLAAYGFGSYTYAGNGGLPSVFGPDGIHLTNHAFDMLSRYLVNILAAPYSHALQPHVSHSSASAFTGGLLDRLDADRAFGGGGKDKEGKFTLFALGSYNRTSWHDIGMLNALGKEGGNATIGGEWYATSRLRAGFAVGLSDSSGTLDNGDELKDGVVQFAGYLSYDNGRWFADGLLGYGHHDLELKRAGILDPVTGQTNANTFSTAVQGGYRFDLGGIKAGPVLGFTYTRAKVEGYDEGGDPMLAYTVGAQKLESSVGEAGVQMHVPLGSDGDNAHIYLNLSLLHEFGAKERLLISTLEQAPLLPIQTEIGNFESRNYGKVGGGFAFDVSLSRGATVSASSTFGRDDVSQFNIGASLDYSF